MLSHTIVQLPNKRNLLPSKKHYQLIRLVIQMAEKNTKGSGMKLVLLHRFGGMLRPCSQGGGTVPGATRVYLAQRGARLGAATSLRAEQRANL